jgi:FkbM family methyltransferase
MSLPERIRRLTYQPFIVRIIQFLHIRSLMRWAYYLWARPRDRKKQISFNGIKVQFNIATPLELRLVETPFEKSMGDEQYFLQKLLSVLHPGDVAYDIGASIGVHTVLMAKKVGQRGKIIAFEPESNSYASLQANINLNRLRNVISLKVALGNNFAESVLYSKGGTADFSFISGSKLRPNSKVKMMPGDILVREKNLPLPKVIKIDVEGYEFYVIEGLKKTLKHNACENVLCEIHPDRLPKEISVNSVINLLKKFGFNHFESYFRGETYHTHFYKR